MNLAIILNGISSDKKIFHGSILPALQQEHRVDVFETQSKDHAIALAADATAKNAYEIIFAAGGDGTLNQVINGLLEYLPGKPKLGLIPLGSGNDFARTVSATSDPARLAIALRNPRYRQIDIGEIYFTDFDNNPAHKFFINVADIGMGPEVVRRVTRFSGTLPSAMAYYAAILKTFFSYRKMVVTADSGDWKWSGKLRSLAVANGNYYGHGLCIAPDAKPDDELFDVFICGDVSVFDFILQSETLKKGKLVLLDEVQYKKTKSIHLISDQFCLIEGDGEVFGKLPATIALTNRSLPLLIV